MATLFAIQIIQSMDKGTVSLVKKRLKFVFFRHVEPRKKFIHWILCLSFKIILMIISISKALRSALFCVFSSALFAFKKLWSNTCQLVLCFLLAN
jgi:hypothetical protein